MENLRSFEDLEVWKISREIRISISSLIKTFPPEEKYRLTDQMIRCSRSVTNNIAEGYGRFHYQENIQFCRHSRGSLFELKDHLMIAVEEKYMNQEDLKMYDSKINSALALLNGYINYLTKRKQTDNN
jgi:four helix bundle protein